MRQSRVERAARALPTAGAHAMSARPWVAIEEPTGFRVVFICTHCWPTADSIPLAARRDKPEDLLMWVSATCDFHLHNPMGLFPL